MYEPSLASLEGCLPGMAPVAILRGARERAAPAITAKPLREDDDFDLTDKQNQRFLRSRTTMSTRAIS
jgi:hypothetical protein